MFERREEILRQGEIDVVEGCHATKESNRELKREYSLCRSRLRKISSYQPTECPGINSSNGRKVWSIDPIEYVRRAPYVFDPGGGGMIFSYVWEEEARERGHRECHELPLSTSSGPSTFSSNPLFFEEWETRTGRGKLVLFGRRIFVRADRVT